MAFIQRVLKWALGHGSFFTCHDVQEAFGCTAIEGSLVCNQIRARANIQVETKVVSNPNPKLSAVTRRKTVVATKVLSVTGRTRRPQYRVDGVGVNIHGKPDGKPPVSFASLREAQDNGYVRSSITDAVKVGRTYCGYRWTLTEVGDAS